MKRLANRLKGLSGKTKTIIAVGSWPLLVYLSSLVLGDGFAFALMMSGVCGGLAWLAHYITEI